MICSIAPTEFECIEKERSSERSFFLSDRPLRLLLTTVGTELSARLNRLTTT